MSTTTTTSDQVSWRNCLLILLLSSAAVTLTPRVSAQSAFDASQSFPTTHTTYPPNSADPSAAEWSPEPGPINGDVQPGGHQSNWLDLASIGYDSGFEIASKDQVNLQSGNFPFRLKINGWGQLRHTVFDSENSNPDLNEFGLKRGRLVFSGSAFTSDFAYFFQIDGRSSDGDDIRLLDYYLSYDVGHHQWGLDRGRIGFRTGRYKMPFTMARYLSGREFEFSDRSLSSIFFDVNRSLGWGIYGETPSAIPLNWEVALFNGLVTGGAETGSSGQLDNNFAYSARVYCYPLGDWGLGQLADLDGHESLAMRVGAGFAASTIDRSGATEFSRVRVVDSGATLSSIIPLSTSQYSVNIYSMDASTKYFGWSFTTEVYLRQVFNFEGADVADLFDHGLWLQVGKFLIPNKLQAIARYSYVAGDSGTLGASSQSSEEIAGGLVWYARNQNAKLTADMNYLTGASINSSALDIAPGDTGWLYRSQIQFAF